MLGIDSPEITGVAERRYARLQLNPETVASNGGLKNLPNFRPAELIDQERSVGVM